MKWAIGRPHPAVQPLVSRYIGYEQRDVELTVHRGLPSRHVTLIVSLTDPVRVSGPAGKLTAAGLIGGLHTNPVLIAQDRAHSGVHLELNPLGVRAFLGISAAELSGRVIGLAELGHPALARLPDRLATTSHWSDRFGILDEVLASTADERLSRTAEIGHAWRVMIESSGRARIADVADQIGRSRRHLNTMFHAETGLSPKQVSRILRFEHAAKLLRRGSVDLARLAIECGYYDQAHLSNEWRALAGCSPRTWIKEELPFLQDEMVFGTQTDCHD